MKAKILTSLAIIAVCSYYIGYITYTHEQQIYSSPFIFGDSMPIFLDIENLKQQKEIDKIEKIVIEEPKPVITKPKPITKAKAPTPAPTPTASEIVVQNELHRLHNASRTQAGLQGLTYSYQLQQSAQEKANYMASNECWSHTCGGSWSVLVRRYFNKTHVGENLARGWSTDAGAFNGLMNSPTHRANIMSSNFYYIGIARATSASGEVYIVSHYASK